MPITPAQRVQRQKHLGSSDMPVILGISPYSQTANDIYWSKVAPLAEDDGPEHLSIGNYMEEALIQFAADELGRDVLHEEEKDLYYVAQYGPGKGLFAANLDGLMADRSAAVECKYCNAEFAQGYGDEGSDQVPDHVLVQCQHQMYCSGLDTVWVAVAKAGYCLTMNLYRVRRDEQLIETMVEYGVQWWRDHVEAEKPPEDTPPMYVLKAIGRAPDKSISLGPELLPVIEQYEKAKAAGKKSEDEAEKLKAQIIHALGDAEEGLLPNGRTITYHQYSRANFDNKRLERERPEIATQYAGRSTYRTLYVKAAKKRAKSA